MEGILTLQGRDLHESDLVEIRDIILAHPCWSRRRLAVELAQVWNWRTATGQVKHFAAYSLLRKLEQRGCITLPALRRKFYPRLPLRFAPNSEPAVRPTIIEALTNLLPLSLEIVRAGHPDCILFSRYLACYHYLSYRGAVGENLGYLVRDRQGRELACVLFGAAAWKTQPRDAWIGWDPLTRARKLSFLTNNTRFLILPWVRAPHLASHILGRITRRLANDWRAKYNHPVYLVETFVDRELFKGTCYRAANWSCVGQTKGRSRQDRFRTLHVPVKDIYLYPLTPGFREQLCHA